MAKRYDGNSGRVIHIDEGRPAAPAQPGAAPAAVLRSLPERLLRLLPKGLARPELEDLLLMLLLYLLYRETADSEWLIALGLYLFDGGGLLKGKEP